MHPYAEAKEKCCLQYTACSHDKYRSCQTRWCQMSLRFMRSREIDEPPRYIYCAPNKIPSCRLLLFAILQAMNGLETAAGAIFVELIRQQAERPPSPTDTNWSSLLLGQATGRHQHHPQAMKVRPHHLPPCLYPMIHHATGKV